MKFEEQYLENQRLMDTACNDESIKTSEDYERYDEEHGICYCDTALPEIVDEIIAQDDGTFDLDDLHYLADDACAVAFNADDFIDCDIFCLALQDYAANNSGYKKVFETIRQQTDYLDRNPDVCVPIPEYERMVYEITFYYSLVEDARPENKDETINQLIEQYRPVNAEITRKHFGID